MDGVVGATRQRLAARLSAGWDGIGAASPLRVAQLQEFGQRGLTAGARLHQARRARARLARPAVAHLLAPMSFTIQHLGTDFLTGEMSRAVESFLIRAARDGARGHSAVTDLLNLQLAGLTGPAVANLRARVLTTVE